MKEKFFHDFFLIKKNNFFFEKKNRKIYQNPYFSKLVNLQTDIYLQACELFCSHGVQNVSIFDGESKSENIGDARASNHAMRADKHWEKTEILSFSHYFWTFWRAQRARKCTHANFFPRFGFSMKFRCVLHPMRASYLWNSQLNRNLLPSGLYRHIDPMPWQ